MTFSFQDLKDILEYSILDTKDFLIDIQGLIFAVAVFTITFFAVKLVRRLFNRLVTKGVINRPTSVTLFTIFKYFIWVIVSVMVMNSFGMKVSVLLASVAALLVGVGIGLQQLFNDVASGIIMLIERNILVMDVIELEGDLIGRVEAIGLRTSKLRTRDDTIMIIPNSKFVNDMMVNWSHFGDNTRFKIEIRMAFDTNPDLVKRLLLECTQGIEKLSDEPKPYVHLAHFGKYYNEFELFFWSNDPFGVEGVKSQLRFKIEETLRKNNISIPLPHKEVTLGKESIKALSRS